MTLPKLKAAVLISAGRHPATGVPRAARGDVAAMALGRRLFGDGLRVVHAGAADEPALEDYLALCAGTIEVVALPDGGDPVAALAGVLKDVDLVLTGTRAESGAGSGLFPYALAKALGRPMVANVLEAEIEGAEARIRQFLPKGSRRLVAVSLPAVLAVHPLAKTGLGYAYASRVSGRIIAASPAIAGKGANVPALPWTVEQAARQPVRLKVEEKRPAHERMRAATVSETKGGVVASQGSAVDKAQLVLNYLRTNRLIEL
jgi:N,N-dimethylglycine/sarcosine catabolism electron transfer flavoprotein subunit beta